jgi:hypothetical protein
MNHKSSKEILSSNLLNRFNKLKKSKSSKEILSSDLLNRFNKLKKSKSSKEILSSDLLNRFNKLKKSKSSKEILSSDLLNRFNKLKKSKSISHARSSEDINLRFILNDENMIKGCKNIQNKKKFTDKQINDLFDYTYVKILNKLGGNINNIYQKLTVYDIELIFNTIVSNFVDVLFFEWMIKLNIEIEFKLDNSIKNDINIAGLCDVYPNGDEICNSVITIWISRQHLNMNIKEMGRICKDPLECLIFTVAHEIVHLLQFAFCGDDVRHDKIFNNISYSLFRFTDHRYII